MMKTPMAKLLRGVGIALVPIVLYFGVFVAFEPNNYFGLKEKADGTDIMAILRQYEETPQDRIILGDSRMAKFDMDLVEEVSGKTYTNLAYGGASLKEQLDLLEWTLEQNEELTEVVFGLSFYTLNQSYNHDRKVLNALYNPFAYMTNLGYNINMLTNLHDYLTPGRTVGHEGETMDPAKYEYVDFTDFATGQTVKVREKIAEHIEGLLGRSKNWQLNIEQLARLLDVIDRCLLRGVRFTVVLPPAHDDVLRYVVKSCGIDEGMELALSALRVSGARVLDYEFSNRTAFADDQFFDGFHLDEVRGLPAFTELLFSEIGLPKEVKATTPGV